MGVLIASTFFAVLDPLLQGLFRMLGWANFYIDHKFYITSIIGATLLLQTVIMNPGGLGQVVRPITRWLAGERFSLHDESGPIHTGTAHVRA